MSWDRVSRPAGSAEARADGVASDPWASTAAAPGRDPWAATNDGSGPDPWGGTSPTGDGISADTADHRAHVELIGDQLRVSGDVQMGRFARVSDFANLLDGFFQLKEVTLLTRLGEPTRVTVPELRVRLDDISVVGEKEPPPLQPDEERYEEMQPRHLVVMTVAHIVYGTTYLHAQADLETFVDALHPRFVPLTDVHVRWLADRRLAARYPFALLQRRQIIGVATKTGEGVAWRAPALSGADPWSAGDR